MKKKKPVGKKPSRVVVEMVQTLCYYFSLVSRQTIALKKVTDSHDNLLMLSEILINASSALAIIRVFSRCSFKAGESKWIVEKLNAELNEYPERTKLHDAIDELIEDL